MKRPPHQHHQRKLLLHVHPKRSAGDDKRNPKLVSLKCSHRKNNHDVFGSHKPQYLSGDSTSSNCLHHVRRSCEESYFSQQDFAEESIQQIEVENDENKEVENPDQLCNSHDVNINTQNVKAGPSVECEKTYSAGMSTENSVQIPNAQPQKHQHIMPPNTSSSAAETEETYVEYWVMHVQGGG